MESEKSTRKIGYARVSTAEQNLDMQIEALKRYGVPEQLIITEKASGGSLEKRPGLSRALRMAQHEGLEFVVWKLDRLGRTLTGILQIMELFHKRGIVFVSLTEKIDTNSAMGKAFIHLAAVFAQLERDLIRERTLAGIKRAKERGEIGGRPRGMTDERIARARELLAEGRRGEAVWRELKKIKGPGISRAVYYAWQKRFDAEQDANDLKQASD
jgi:DNA invertase Pin-like site-specific DNA recombinase